MGVICSKVIAGECLVKEKCVHKSDHKPISYRDYSCDTKALKCGSFTVQCVKCSDKEIDEKEDG